MIPPSALPVHPRVLALEAIARAADPMMADLPIYHRGLEVEAVGFRLAGPEGRADLLVGALVTPWAVSLVVMTVTETPYDAAMLGRAEPLVFPAGPRGFHVAGDPAVGLFRQATIAAPCLDLPDQAAARGLALAAVEALMRAPDPADGRAPETGTAAPAPAPLTPATLAAARIAAERASREPPPEPAPPVPAGPIGRRELFTRKRKS